MNKIEVYLHRAGAFDDVDHWWHVDYSRLVLQAFRNWLRESDEEIPFSTNEMGRLLPCCWEGLVPHPRFRMIDRSFLFWLGYWDGLYARPGPQDDDHAPPDWEQAYYEFYLGHLKLSCLASIPFSKCSTCGEPFGINDDVESDRCADCERYDEYAAARYAELEECYRCGEVTCICEEAFGDDDDDERYDYDPTLDDPNGDYDDE